MMITNVKGQFSKVSGALFLDESDLANSPVEAAIEAASIHTRDKQREAHLKSPDFSDVVGEKGIKVYLDAIGDLRTEVRNHEISSERSGQSSPTL